MNSPNTADFGREGVMSEFKNQQDIINCKANLHSLTSVNISATEGEKSQLRNTGYSTEKGKQNIKSFNLSLSSRPACINCPAMTMRIVSLASQHDSAAPQHESVAQYHESFALQHESIAPQQSLLQSRTSLLHCSTSLASESVAQQHSSVAPQHESVAPHH